MNELIAAAQQARNALSEACGGRCNSEHNPCWYYEAAIRLEAAIEQAKRQQALDKMAENARELGLDYEPGACNGMPAYEGPLSAAPVQEPVVVPRFIRKRLEREIESATHPKGMSVHDGRTRAMANDIAYLLKVIDSYTTPPAQRQWVGLTNEEIALVCGECAASAHNWNDISFARAIEAKLREKNGGAA